MHHMKATLTFITSFLERLHFTPTHTADCKVTAHISKKLCSCQYTSVHTAEVTEINRLDLKRYDKTTRLFDKPP